MRARRRGRILFNNYFASGTNGDCPLCHTQVTSPSTFWTYLSSNNCPPPMLNNPNTSCLAWFAGNMPTATTPCNGQAVSDINAWIAAGAQNN